MRSGQKPRPKVLHLLSDWKWTGPAEPIVNLCRALMQKGFVVDLACKAAPPEAPKALEHRARERLLDPVLDLKLDKRPNLLANRRDIRRLAELIDDEEYQIIHVHSTHDHFIGSRAARRANNRPRIVRTNHRGSPLASHLFQKYLIRGWTQGWVAYSEACRAEDCAAFAIPDDLSVVVEGAVDLERFHVGIPGDAKRRAFGFPPDSVVFGVVARIQPHRRFDVIIEAFDRALQREPRVRGLILGRGTRQKKLVDDPLRQRGLADRIIHAGYRADDYIESLAAMDALIFLVPGTDGSCRAVREAMAVGKPVIASRRGILPELVRDDEDGLVIDDSVPNLVDAMLGLVDDTPLRARLGQAAAEGAAARFRLDAQAQKIGDLYMRIADLP